MTPRSTLEPQPKLYFTSNTTRAAKQYATTNIFRALWGDWITSPKAIHDYFWQLVGRQIVACEIKAMHRRFGRRGPLGLSESIAIRLRRATC
jgi:hypothetical protein